MLSLKRFVSWSLRHPAIQGPASYLLRRGPFTVSEATWNQDYAAGRWAYLGDLDEMPRYAVISGYVRTIGTAASVLDIGCGTGHLSAWVRQDADRRYVGIDLAEVAIEQARQHASGQSTFEVADAAKFDPGGQFDIIVFNELLYYMSDPARVVDRYADFLAPGGVMIVSMYNSVTTMRMWRRCAPRLTVVDQVRVRATSGMEWNVRLCQPNGTALASAVRKESGRGVMAGRAGP